MSSLQQKIIISGSTLEFFQYKQRKKNPFSSLKYRRRSFPYSSIRRVDHMQRTKGNFFRLLLANESIFHTFLTLTFSEKNISNDDAFRFLKQWVRCVRRRVPDFRYAGVVEYQKRGSLHFHLVCSSKKNQTVSLLSLWKHGVALSKSIYSYEPLCQYLIKTMKNNTSFSFPRFRNSYFYSHGINKPLEFRDPKEIQMFLLNPSNQLLYEDTFQSRFVGKILYQKYKRGN